MAGDNRAYAHVIALRAVESTDLMTAHRTPQPIELLEWVSSRLINEVPGITCVSYDISSKSSATMEWE